MKKHAKIIFHIDLNAFFATVAEIINPYLRNKAFGIGRYGGRGVLATASYEARKYGITSAMSTKEALNRYPRLIIVNPDFEVIEKYSNLFIELLKEYTHLVEKASIDEAYVDITELAQKRHPLEVANEIQQRLLKEHQLKCSIGIAPTLFLAKMASELKKPMGISILRIREITTLLYPLDIKDIHGLGKKTYPHLYMLGIKTIADFMNPENKLTILKILTENHYDEIKCCLEGKSSNVVYPEKYSSFESIGHSQTYLKDLVEINEITNELYKLTKMVLERLNENNYFCKTIHITIKYYDFKQITRSISINEYTNSLYTIYDVIETLFDNNYNLTPIRLLGVSVSNLIEKNEIEEEYTLFSLSDIVQKESEILKTMKEINAKYQKELLKRGIKE